MLTKATGEIKELPIRLQAVMSPSVDFLAAFIYVLDEGRVVESGTHDTLMANAGLYAAMYSAQKDSYG